MIAAESANVSVCGVPWWMNVMSSVDSEDGGGELSAVETLGCFSPSVVISRDVRRRGDVEKLLYSHRIYSRKRIRQAMRRGCRR